MYSLSLYLSISPSLYIYIYIYIICTIDLGRGDDMATSPVSWPFASRRHRRGAVIRKGG